MSLDESPSTSTGEKLMTAANKGGSRSGLQEAEKKPRKTPLFLGFAEDRRLLFIRENRRIRKVHRGSLQRHMLPCLSFCRLTDISADTLTQRINALELTGLAHGSCHRQFRTAECVLNRAVRPDAPAGDAACRHAALSPEAGRKSALRSSGEFVLLPESHGQNAPRPSVKAIRLTPLTGTGKSEILGARREDADFQRSVPAAKNFTGRRFIPLNTEAQKLFRKLPECDGVPLLFSPAGKRDSFPSPAIGRGCAGSPGTRICVGWISVCPLPDSF